MKLSDEQALNVLNELLRIWADQYKVNVEARVMSKNEENINNSAAASAM